MKFTAEREKMMAALGKVIGAVERRTTMPVLSNVLVTVCTVGSVRFLATDLEVFAEAECEVQVPSLGEAFCVCADKLKAALAAIDADVVTLEHQGVEIKLSGGLYEFKLPVLPAEEFPRPVTDCLPFAEFGGGVLPRLIKAVGHAQSRDDGKWNLCGIHIEPDMKNDRLQAVATDGHRLSVSSIAYDNVGNVGKPFILPTKGCGLVAAMPGPLVLRRTDNTVEFEGRDSSISARLVEGEFPAYRRVIPSSLLDHLVADREALIGAVEAALVVAGGESRSVLLTWSSGEVMQVSALGSVGSCVAEVPIQSESEAFLSSRVNSKYLLQALQALDGPEVFVKWGLQTDPLLLTPVDLGPFDERLEVVMPMRA